MVKQDRRTKYTKMALRQALLNLMKERPVNKITVTEVCEAADINRGTFYIHYLDVYDLLSKIESELFDSIKESLETSYYEKSLAEFLNEVLCAIVENADLCKILFLGSSDFSLIKKVLDIAYNISMKEWSGPEYSIPPQAIEYMYSFMANGSVGIIQQWAKNDFNKPPAEIAEIIAGIVYSIVDSYKKPEKKSK